MASNATNSTKDPKIAEGTQCRCPLCESEVTTVRRNVNDRPYIVCRQLQTTINLRSPTADAFLKEYVETEETDDTKTKPDANAVDNAAEETDDETADDSEGDTLEELLKGDD